MSLIKKGMAGNIYFRHPLVLGQWASKGNISFGEYISSSPSICSQTRPKCFRIKWWTRRWKLRGGHPDTLLSMHDLALSFWRQGHYKICDSGIGGQKEGSGNKHLGTLITMSNLTLRVLCEEHPGIWKPTASWMGNTGSDQDGNKTRVYWFKNKRGVWGCKRGDRRESSWAERILWRMM